jgi:hypothetical protein
MTYKIEKHVPIPAVRGAGSKFPLEQMEVGDSFVVDIKAERLAAMVAANIIRQKNGKTFASRSVDGGKFRIWRTA